LQRVALNIRQLANHTPAINVVTFKFNTDNQCVTALSSAQLRFSFKLKSYGSFFLKGASLALLAGAVSRQVLKKGCETTFTKNTK
jgi:hypothetical protein